ncbi:MAG: hypothetical protein ABIO70_10960 [Pseudomonadota bacterium]
MSGSDDSLWDLGEEAQPLTEPAPPNLAPPPIAATPTAPEGEGAPEECLPPPRLPLRDDDGADEEVVGTSERGRAASDALVTLGRAARSYLLYEPDNEAIRKFLDEMKRTFWSFFEAYGALRLTIRPWEMVLGAEVVYLNRDRERSLSFRLFRDGVRRIAIQPDVPWEEITQLLGILSIRYVGVRQQEDDIVTLLWKAGFKKIEVDSVEGFVPEDDETEVVDSAMLGDLVGEAGGEGGDGGDAGEDDGGDGHTLNMLYGGVAEGFDVPWPEFTQRVPLAHTPVDEVVLMALQGEDSNVALPSQCVSLLREILEVACNPVEPLELEEAIPILREIRDFLLSEGLLSSLLEVMQIIQALPFREKDLERREELLEAFTDERALSRIIRSVPAGSREVPEELLALVATIPGNRVPLLLIILRTERSNTARWVTRNLLVESGVGHEADIARGVRESEPPVAADLLQVLAAVNQAKGRQLALEIVADADVEVQLQALAIIEHGVYDQAVGQRLARLLEAGSVEVRLRALRMLETHRERWAFHAVATRLQSSGGRDLENRELDALALAMVRIWEERALHTFLGWIKPKGLLERVKLGQASLKRAAVTGLAVIPGDQAEEYIRLVAKTASEELHTHCMQCLVRHRRLGVRVDDGR